MGIYVNSLIPNASNGIKIQKFLKKNQGMMLYLSNAPLKGVAGRVFYLLINWPM